jgi:hypothetical protein
MTPSELKAPEGQVIIVRQTWGKSEQVGEPVALALDAFYRLGLYYQGGGPGTTYLVVDDEGNQVEGAPPAISF